jgi:hypothetical protein
MKTIFYLDQKHGSKNCEKLTKCCNLANGRVEFDDVWLIKLSFKTIHIMKACQLSKTKLQKKRIKIDKPKTLT